MDKPKAKSNAGDYGASEYQSHPEYDSIKRETRTITEKHFMGKDNVKAPKNPRMLSTSDLTGTGRELTLNDLGSKPPVRIEDLDGERPSPMSQRDATTNEVNDLFRNRRHE